MMQSELDEPRWAVIDSNGVARLDISYEYAAQVVVHSGDPNATICTAEAARRFRRKEQRSSPE